MAIRYTANPNDGNRPHVASHIDSQVTRLAITPVQATSEYRFQQALRRCGQKIGDMRTDADRQSYKHAVEDNNSLSLGASNRSAGAMVNDSSPRLPNDSGPDNSQSHVGPGGHATATLSLENTQKSELAHRVQQDRTQMLIARCVEAINHQVNTDIQNATIIIELPNDLFNGSVITLRRSSTTWSLTARVPDEHTRLELQHTLPQLQTRFREKELGELQW